MHNAVPTIHWLALFQELPLIRSHPIRFFLDTVGVSSPPLSQEDKARISSRIDRFGKEGMSEGNMNIRKKLSMDELVKSVVNYLCVCKWRDGRLWEVKEGRGREEREVNLGYRER